MLFLLISTCYFIGLTNGNYGSPPPLLTEDVEAEPYRPFVASCYDTRDDITNIYWTNPKGLLIMNDQKGNVYSSQQKGELLLSIVQPDQTDEGVYLCQKRGDEGETTILKSISLRVLSKAEPTFEDPYVVVEAFEGENVTFTCEALGDQPIQYTWFNQHEAIITVSSNATVLLTENGTQLKLFRVSKETSGVYTCKASNQLGSNSKLFELTVKQRISNGILSVHVQNTTHDSVKFLITAQGSEISGFEARYSLVNENNFTTVRWSVGEEKEVTGLLSGGKYYFQFKIVSSDNWTEILTVALPPGPPEIIVRQMTSNKLYMEFFRPFYLFYYDSIQRYIIKYRSIQQVRGNTWDYSNCEVTIELPSCRAGGYEISNLASRVYYSVTVQAAGPGGYSDPSEIKIYTYAG